MESSGPFTDSFTIHGIEQYLAQIVEDEKRIHGTLEELRAERANLEQTLFYMRRRAGIPPKPEVLDKPESESDRKGTLFEWFAAQRADQGFSVADVFKLFRDQSIEIGRNYPYFLVAMRYKNRLRKVGGTRSGKRYYWISNGAASE